MSRIYGYKSVFLISLISLVCGFGDAAQDVTSHYVRIRREKMQELKRQLAEVGHSVNVADEDSAQYSGIRRLRILHAQAKPHIADMESQAQPVPTAKTVPAPAPASALPSKPAATKPITAASVTETLKPKSLVTSGGAFGLSTGMTVLIFLGGALLLAAIAFVVYKYMTWKPKMVAKKGYKAVTKSRGLAVSESEGAAEISDQSPQKVSAPSLIVASRS